MTDRFVISPEYEKHVASFGPGSNRVHGLAYEPPNSLHILACPAVPLNDVLDIIPEHFVSDQIKNAPNDCCKQVNNLEIEAWFTQEDIENVEGRPDLYKLHCNVCSDCHARLMVNYKHPMLEGRKLSPDILKLTRPMW